MQPELRLLHTTTRRLTMSKTNDKAITASNPATNNQVEGKAINNKQKCENYIIQLRRLKRAMNKDNAFYLEAIVIEYAIMEDRTTSILSYEGNEIIKKNNNFILLNEKLTKIANLANKTTSMPPWICRYFSDDNSNHLIERIRVWKRNRDAFTHSKLFRQITTTEELKGIAEDGANLCKELCNKANNYKRMVERHKKKS